MSTIPTNRGPMVPSEIIDELLYRQYHRAREANIKPLTLAYFFGEVPAAAMAQRYAAEKQTEADSILCWPEGV